MKKLLMIIIITCASLKSSAQADELAQLALNIEKLAQFKQILSDLKKAYEILYGGYSTIKNISEGNFSIHETFLNGLLQVSPAVRSYKRVSEIIKLQLQLVKEYKTAHARFRTTNLFSPGELKHLGNVYDRLFKESVSNLDALANVLAANKLRMSDDERLKAIDNIFSSMQQKLVFLRHFNSSTSVLGIARSKEQNDVDVTRRLHGINK